MDKELTDNKKLNKKIMVMKRNGTEVKFDIAKIISAVERANDEVAETERLQRADLSAAFLDKARHGCQRNKQCHYKEKHGKDL